MSKAAGAGVRSRGRTRARAPGATPRGHRGSGSGGGNWSRRQPRPCRAGLANGRHQTVLRHGDGDVEVLGLESEGAGHAAASRRDLLDLEARRERERVRQGCRSSKPCRPRKSWHFRPLPATICGMQMIVVILVAFVREIVLSRARLQAGKHRSPSTSGSPEAGQTTAAASSARPRVLGLRFPPVATLEGRPCHRQARDGRRLAPPGVPPVLEMEILPRKAGVAREPRRKPANSSND